MRQHQMFVAIAQSVPGNTTASADLSRALHLALFFIVLGPNE